MDQIQLKKIANQIRQDVIKMITEAGSGHPGGSLSVVEMLVSLYFGGILKYDPQNPHWEERDRFILSKAHAAPALYAVLSRAGFFPKSELSALRKIDSRLQGHTDRIKLPCLETSGGALGQGLSIGIGMALAALYQKKDWQVFVLMSDAEQEEGSTMEGMLCAVQYKLNNLVGIIDANRFQIDGKVDEIMGGETIKERYLAFGWEIIEINGHSFSELLGAFEKSKSIEKPACIFANTIKGRGVSFMENKVDWHGRVPTKEEAKVALEELKEEAKKLKILSSYAC